MPDMDTNSVFLSTDVLRVFVSRRGMGEGGRKKLPCVTVLLSQTHRF